MSNDKPHIDRRVLSARPSLAAFIIFSLWLIVVGCGVYQHVLWRDEMRALSLTLEAPNIFAVPATAQGEGHPALWYIVLSLGHSLFRTNAVLPGASLLFGVIGAALLFWKGPFPRWWKTLFLFSGLAVFEYPVMARSYALVMPLLFATTLFVTAEKRRYWLIALLIFCAMQVDIYTTVLAPFLLLPLLKIWRISDRRDSLGIVLCGLGVVLGLVVAIFAVYPPKQDLVTASMSGRISTVQALQIAVLDPGSQYISLLYGHDHVAHLPFFPTREHLGPFAAAFLTALMYASCLGLASDTLLFTGAVLGIWVTACFAILIYPMYYRHAGVWLIFVICLYWIKKETPPVQLSEDSKRSGIETISWWSLTSLLVIGLGFGIPELMAYSAAPSSESRQLGHLLNTETDLRGAIVVPDPQELVESLPYYASNPIYMVREHKYGQLANWISTSTIDLTLAELMETAGNLQKFSGKPIVLILGEPLSPEPHIACVGFGRSFRYTKADYDTFARSTRRLDIGTALDETYAAYLFQTRLTDTASNAVNSGLANSNKRQANHDNGDEGDSGAARLQCGSHTRADAGGNPMRHLR